MGYIVYYFSSVLMVAHLATLKLSLITVNLGIMAKHNNSRLRRKLPKWTGREWVDLKVTFDWKRSLVDVAVQDTTRKTNSLQTNKGVCAYNGIHSILLRGYTRDPAKEYVQAWCKIELYPELYPSL